jgi:ubiquinone/menaquinone biosynthesis C-methylase UbiE
MGFHTFDPAEADRLEEPTRFRFCSREELLQWLPTGRQQAILEVGSGTGFYTDEIAPFVGHVVALDLQVAMHDRYRERGLSENVAPVTADAGLLPFETATFDGAFSTMTFHETATDRSVEELYRVLAPGGRAVVVDWSADGNGESGPPRSERYDLDRARALLSAAGFDVEAAATRSETFAVVAEV